MSFNRRILKGRLLLWFSLILSMSFPVMISLCSRFLADSISEEFSRLGLSVNFIEIIDQDRIFPGWKEKIKAETGIGREACVWVWPYGEYEVAGCGWQLAELVGMKFQEGGFFGELEQMNNSNLIVLGSEYALDHPMLKCGDTVNVNGAAFTVCGIAEKGNGDLLMETDNKLFVPFGYSKEGAKMRWYFQNNGSYLEYYLDNYLGEDNYLLFDFRNVMDTADEIMKAAGNVITMISLVSLTVSYLNLLAGNLSTVKARSYEVGVRKSLGASNGNIMIQFMGENAFMVISAAAVSLVICCLASLILSVGFIGKREVVMLFKMAVCGMLCGLYPGYKAGRITIMEAIRS